MKTTEQQTTRKQDIRNLQFAARATYVNELHQDIDDYTGFAINKIEFGITDLQIWYPRHQKWIAIKNMPFTVICEDLETARTEFYARWKIWLSKKFGIDFLTIERIN